MLEHESPCKTKPKPVCWSQAVTLQCVVMAFKEDSNHTASMATRIHISLHTHWCLYFKRLVIHVLSSLSMGTFVDNPMVQLMNFPRYTDENCSSVSKSKLIKLVLFPFKHGWIWSYHRIFPAYLYSICVPAISYLPQIHPMWKTRPAFDQRLMEAFENLSAIVHCYLPAE